LACAPLGALVGPGGVERELGELVELPLADLSSTQSMNVVVLVSATGLPPANGTISRRP
jgi:hypothetical protein